MEEELYTGVVKKSPQDPSKLVIDCPAVFTWYTQDCRLPAAVRADDMQVGTSVRFTISESGTGAPVATWAEANKKRKAEGDAGLAEDEVGEDLYVGAVHKQSKKDPSMYQIDCPAVASWYTASAKAHAGVLPSDVGLGDVIVFALAEEPEGDQLGPPRVVWSRRASPAERKSWIAQRSEAARVRATKGGGSVDAITVEKLQQKLKAEKAARIQAEKEAKKALESAHQEFTADLTFSDAASAEGALALYGSVLKGQELRVELDARSPDGRAIQVFNLLAGTSERELRAHFQEAGGIEKCVISKKRGGGDGDQ